MNTLVFKIPMFNAALACFDRIESFSRSDARRDDRLPLFEPAEFGERSSSSTSSVPVNIEMEILHQVVTWSKVNSSLTVTTQNASFSWVINGQLAVSDLSFTFYRRQFCFAIGPVGSGKSTMLKGLLDGTPSSGGFVYSNCPEISFVGQSPWIRNRAVQENILGVSAFEEGWYSQVVHACGLDSDFLVLPKGHGMPFEIQEESNYSC
jgi:ABC-type transport system involved in cytochrome bd biosynthesis fused ATPase/permease subunit